MSHTPDKMSHNIYRLVSSALITMSAPFGPDPSQWEGRWMKPCRWDTNMDPRFLLIVEKLKWVGRMKCLGKDIDKNRK